MRRICAALSTLPLSLLLWVALAEPAAAKGPESATITGPGLDDPIDVALLPETGDTPSYLVVALREQTALWSAAQPELTPAAPPGDLHERYTLTWRMMGPGDADPDEFTVRQDIYPNADFGAPVVHTHPSTFLGGGGGWFQAAPELNDTLAALGVPVRGVDVELASPAARPGAADATAPVVRREVAVWPSVVAALGGIGAGLGAGLRLGGVRRRRRGAGQRVPAQAA